jgi:hypothetical protein
MPHWEAIIDTASPEILHGLKGDPQRVREKLMASAPEGANVRSVSWLSGKDQARIVVEGPEAETYLNTLGATDRRMLLSSGERTTERGSKPRGSESSEEGGPV